MVDLPALLKKWIENSSPRQKLFVSLLAFSLLATGALLSLGDTNVTGDPLTSTPFYYVSAFVKLIAVLLLIVGSSVIFRKWLQPGMSGRSNKQMRLVETIRLSPKQSLHLVVVGDQKLLIGATDQNVSLITPVEETLLPLTAEDSQVQPGFDFSSMIRSFNLSTPLEAAKGKE